MANPRAAGVTVLVDINRDHAYDRKEMKGRRMASGTLVLGGVDPLPVPRLPPEVVTWRYVSSHEAFVGDPLHELGCPIDPHPDLYLEAARLDVLDDAAVIAFMNVYGVPSVDPLWSGGLRWAHSDSEHPRLIGLPVIDADLAASIRATPLPDFGTFKIATGRAVRAGLLTIRFLVETWRYLGENGPPPLMLSAESQLTLEGADDRPTSLLATRFARVLDSCLAPICPRAFVLEDDAEAPEWVVGEPPPLLAVLALQLARHVERGTDWSHCANERCSKLFEYQRNRDQKDPTRRRAGARYCSDWCADAARQRRSKGRRRVLRQRAKQD